MSTTHHVKMAKASQKDIDAALDLYQFLEAMRGGRPAAHAVEEFDLKGYGGNCLQLQPKPQGGA